MRRNVELGKDLFLIVPAKRREIRTTVMAVLGLLVFVSMPNSIAFTQSPAEGRTERFRRMSTDAETKGLADPFKGITADGHVEAGLFPIRSTGVSTDAVRK